MSKSKIYHDMIAFFAAWIYDFFLKYKWNVQLFDTDQ